MNTENTKRHQNRTLGDLGAWRKALKRRNSIGVGATHVTLAFTSKSAVGAT